MAYATRDDLIKAFGERELILLTAHTVGGSEIDDDVLGRAINDATGEIDGYIGQRYGQSLAGRAVPENLKRIACDITRYRLYDSNVLDVVRDRYKDAIAFLRDVASGRASLGDVAIDADSEFRVLATAADRRFTQNALKDY